MSGFLTTGFTAQVAGAILEPGQYNGSIVQIKETNDHTRNLSGDLKENYRFSNVHDQVAVVVSDENGKGTAIHRFNTCGWKRFEEMPPAERKGLEADPTTGYAVNKKTKARVEDPARTLRCQNIFNQFLNTLQKSDGTMLIKDIQGKEISIADLFVQMKGCKLAFTVENREYNGKTRPEMTAWRKITVPVAVVADEDEDEGDL